MSQDASLRLPVGFTGTCTREDLWSPRGLTLRLPQEAVPDGPYARVPEGSFDTILLEGLTESFGNLERFAKVLAQSLAPGGRLVVDVENACSVRALRWAIEGKLSSLEPFGSLSDPERRATRRRIVHALVAAGLCVEDVYDVPIGNDQVPAEFPTTIFAQGFLPTAWIPRPPASRLWLVATKRTLATGTVLIGPGAAHEQERTTRAVSAFLPDDFEIVCCDRASPDERESSAFQRAIARCRGQSIWFLRAGATADATMFRDLRANAVIGPALPAHDGRAIAPGDLSGLMIAREDVLVLGPFDRGFTTDAITYEEWLLRLDGRIRSPLLVPGTFSSPPLAAGDPDALRTESETLFDRWGPLMDAAAKAAKPEAKPEVDAKTPPPPWQGREPRISLVMMVKNEERFLGECLRRAASCADEIVVVDTGSTDGTIAIAESFGAKVVHTKWNDDFASPRNLGLDHATGDWIFVLDPDEFLADGQEERIRELVRDPKISGYHLVFQNVYSGGKTLGVIMVRLFRNLKGIRWVNRIHEQITPALLREGHPQGLILSISDVLVEHHGYSDEVMDMRNKNERNERIFKLQIAEMPDDIYSLYKYGDFLRRVPDRADDARHWLGRAYERILALPPIVATEIPYASEIAALLALEFGRAGDEAKAREIAERALQSFLATPNLHYIAAMLALRANRPDEAILHFERCLTFKDQVLVVAIQEGITSYVSITGIAQAHLMKGSRAEARRLLEQALALKPDYELAAMTVSKMQAEVGDLGKALITLADLLKHKPDSPGAMQQATMILARLGKKHEARAMGTRAVDLIEKVHGPREARALKEFLVALT